MEAERSGLVRAAGVAGLLVPITSTFSWAVGGLAQRQEFTSLDDDISDLGAPTAESPRLYNEIGANLTGLLLMLFCGGALARAPHVTGQLGESRTY